jgi:hydroxymethylpyrimidine/phosphomethylpyrimidine kinase
VHTALTIAGSDPSGGAGIQGDLKTFHAHGVYGMAVVTALTAQNTTGVTGIHPVPPGFVAEQLETAIYDIPAGATKTGMLYSAEIVEAVAAVLDVSKLPNLVVDPVMIATSGDPLLADDAVDALQRLLFPRATLLTPNVPEAERLTGLKIEGRGDLREAARILSDIGPWAVLIKGGHLPGDTVVDLLHVAGEFVEFEDPRIDTPHTHGTGCALAAAATALLACGKDLRDAVAGARTFVRRGLEQAVVLGHGNNPLNHLAT